MLPCLQTMEGKTPRCALFRVNTHMGLCILSRRVLPRLHTVLRLSTRSTAMASSSLDEHFLPPEAVRGSKTLDRAAFQRKFQLPAIRLAQASLCSTFLRRLAHARLKFSAIKSVLTEPSEDGKVSEHAYRVSGHRSTLVPHKSVRKCFRFSISLSSISVNSA